MLLPQKGTRGLRSMGIPLVRVCFLSPRSDLVLQPFSLTSCCLCFGWVNLYSVVARAAAKVGGLAAGVRVLPHIAWAAAIWTHLLCWGRVLETAQEETQPNTAVRCPTCGRSITIRFGTWSVLSGTDLIVAAFAVCWWWATRQKMEWYMTMGKVAEKMLSGCKGWLFILRSVLRMSCNVFVLECTSDFLIVWSSAWLFFFSFLTVHAN